mmetsp:Transcript_2443/g.7037  ORF Transcript_2443/g.7037 Transcript_2443/m.7037 type:complete len:203 (+) Transcript_2443:282-890(+)
MDKLGGQRKRGPPRTRGREAVERTHAGPTGGLGATRARGRRGSFVVDGRGGGRLRLSRHDAGAHGFDPGPRFGRHDGHGAARVTRQGPHCPRRRVGLVAAKHLGDRHAASRRRARDLDARRRREKSAHPPGLDSQLPPRRRPRRRPRAQSGPRRGRPARRARRPGHFGRHLGGDDPVRAAVPPGRQMRDAVGGRAVLRVWSS